MFSVLVTLLVRSAAYQLLCLRMKVPLSHEFEFKLIVIVVYGEGEDTAGVRLIFFLYLSGGQGGRLMTYVAGLENISVESLLIVFYTKLYNNVALTLRCSRGTLNSTHIIQCCSDSSISFIHNCNIKSETNFDL